jgi:hypothetical protein
VALAARCELHLARIERHLQRLGIDHRAIREPDPPWNGALMAIGLTPVDDRTTLRRALRRLSLLE